MKILVTGSGGREHALAWKAAQSDLVEEVYVAPGNAGTALEEKLANVPIDVMDFPALAQFARDRRVDLTIVGPEAPLVAGVVDYFEDQGLRCFGPTRAAAQLEGSKHFTKDFLTRHGIPTAKYRSFTSAREAIAYVREQGAPVVIKADGLAAGKGVVIAESVDAAVGTIEEMLSGEAFGEAGRRIVVEQLLRGEEASFIVITDGERIVPFASSQDHKPIYEGDRGPNTGGMGAYSPAPVVTDAMHDRIMREVIEPTVAGMREAGMRYQGFLYAGLMIDEAGTPNVIEFNCRFGDPEAQPIVMRMRGDLVALCMSAMAGTLPSAIEFDPRVALTVVLAAGGYPLDYEKGDVISGLDSPFGDSIKVFHAGTRADRDRIVTNGGRVLGVTALGDTVSDAQARAYAASRAIDWRGIYYRKDIGYRAVARERADS